MPCRPRDGRSVAGLLTLTIGTPLATPRGVPLLARRGVPWRLRRSHGPFEMMGFDLLLFGEVLVVVGGEDLLDEGRRVAGRLAWRMPSSRMLEMRLRSASVHEGVGRYPK
jgi:hypothetical protein